MPYFGYHQVCACRIAREDGLDEAVHGVVDKLELGRGDASRQLGTARRVPMEAVALLEGKDAQEFALIEEGDDAEFLVGLAQGLAGGFGEGSVVGLSL